MSKLLRELSKPDSEALRSEALEQLKLLQVKLLLVILLFLIKSLRTNNSARYISNCCLVA